MPFSTKSDKIRQNHDDPVRNIYNLFLIKTKFHPTVRN